MLPPDEAGNVIVAPSADKPDILLRDTTDSVIVPHGDRLVAVLGMSGVIIVDTPDAVLVCSRDRAQDVKSLVDALKDRGDKRLSDLHLQLETRQRRPRSVPRSRRPAGAAARPAGTIRAPSTPR